MLTGLLSIRTRKHELMGQGFGVGGHGWAGNRDFPTCETGGRLTYVVLSILMQSLQMWIFIWSGNERTLKFD
jgi:hypothetical protein